jgi:hypothetical protein
VSAPEPAPVTAKPAVSRWGSHLFRITLLIALIAGAVAVALVLTRPESDDRAATNAVKTPSTSLDRGSELAVAQLESSLRNRDRAAFLQCWTQDGAAQAQARELFHNLTALNARVDLSVLSAAGREADVGVRWALRGDHTMAATKVVIELVPHDTELRVAGVEPAPRTRQPIWMLGRLAVRHGADTVVAATDPATARRVGSLLLQAERDVHAVDGRWHGSLVAYVPADQADFEKLVEGDPGQYDNIAGITTSVDGSTGVGSPQMIAVNPTIFDTLSDDGQRVVVTHEATHLATNAASSTAPDWLIEGFADYVAIGAAQIPLKLAAGPAVDGRGDAGAPLQLPSDEDFSDRDADEQQQAYALSWLAVRMLADRYGQRRLVSFYLDAVAAPNQLDRTLRLHFSTSLTEVTRQWRQLVGRLADAA